MILQALTQYYENLLARGEIAAPGWAPAKISYAPVSYTHLLCGDPV